MGNTSSTEATEGEATWKREEGAPWRDRAQSPGSQEVGHPDYHDQYGGDLSPQQRHQHYGKASAASDNATRNHPLWTEEEEDQRAASAVMAYSQLWDEEEDDNGKKGKKRTRSPKGGKCFNDDGSGKMRKTVMGDFDALTGATRYEEETDDSGARAEVQGPLQWENRENSIVIANQGRTITSSPDRLQSLIMAGHGKDLAPHASPPTTTNGRRTCSHHPRKELDLFCKHHKEVICVTCTCTRHLACQQRYLARVSSFDISTQQVGSPFQGIEEAARELREQVLMSVAQASESKERELREGAQLVGTRRGENNRNLEELVARLEADRDLIIEAATRRCQENVDTLRACAEIKEKALQQQQDTLMARAESLVNGRSTALEVVQSLDVDEKPLELVQTCLQIMNQMNPVLEASTVTEPVERANLCVVLPSPDALLEAITSRGWAGSPEVDAAQCVLTGPSSVAYPIETACIFILQTRDQLGERLPAPEGVVVVRASLVTGETSRGRLVPFNMKDRGQGMYEIIVAITEELLDQELELHVAIGHQTVIDSPKRVFIVHNPLQSNILSGRQDMPLIKSLLTFVPAKHYRLLYRASQDGWSACDFHRRCDCRGATLTLIRCSGGSVFGGYTSESWVSKECNKTDPKAFLFTLQNLSGTGPMKLELEQGREQYAIYCSPVTLVTFGGGHDISICESAFLTNGSYSNLGNTFALPAGQNGSTFLTGQRQFMVLELEVYAVT